MIHFIVLFIAKVVDNALNTTKTIMIQKSRWILAAVAVMLSDFIYLTITKSVVTEGGNIAIAIKVFNDMKWIFLHYKSIQWEVKMCG